VPEHFSWIDHRLIQQHRLRDCDHGAWALYLFLVNVGDAQGLSYYSEASLSRALKMVPLELARLRQQLIAADLIAYQKPLYQVLSLVEAPALASSAAGQLRSVGDILRHVLGGTV
jgi:hypothetical protein